MEFGSLLEAQHSVAVLGRHSSGGARSKRRTARRSRADAVGRCRVVGGMAARGSRTVSAMSQHACFLLSCVHQARAECGRAGCRSAERACVRRARVLSLLPLCARHGLHALHTVNPAATRSALCLAVALCLPHSRALRGPNGDALRHKRHAQPSTTGELRRTFHSATCSSCITWRCSCSLVGVRGQGSGHVRTARTRPGRAPRGPKGFAPPLPP